MRYTWCHIGVPLLLPSDLQYLTTQLPVSTRVHVNAKEQSVIIRLLGWPTSIEWHGLCQKTSGLGWFSIVWSVAAEEPTAPTMSGVCNMATQLHLLLLVLIAITITQAESPPNRGKSLLDTGDVLSAMTLSQIFIPYLLTTYKMSLEISRS